MMNASNNANTTWPSWRSSFRRSQADLLTDYVHPTAERHMEFRANATGLEEYQDEIFDSSMFLNTSLLSAMFESDDEDRVPAPVAPLRRNTGETNPFWKEPQCQKAPGLTFSGKKISKPPGF